VNCRKLKLRCHCGKVPKSLSWVGLSGDHQLVIYWFCGRCRNRVYALKPLSDCWRECTEGEAEPLENVLSAVATEEDDLRFLHSLGVRDPDEVEH